MIKILFSKPDLSMDMLRDCWLQEAGRVLELT
jgi:hypothetical protein